MSIPESFLRLTFRLVPLWALAACGVWPDFPNRTIDAGADVSIATDVRADTSVSDVPGSDVGDAAMDVSPDTAASCPSSPIAGPVTATSMPIPYVGAAPRRGFTIDHTGLFATTDNLDVYTALPIHMAPLSMSLPFDAIGFLGPTTLIASSTTIGSLSNIDTTTGLVTASTLTVIPPLGNIRSIAVNAPGTYLYAASATTSVYAVSTAGAGSLGTLTVPSPAVAVALDPAGTTLFIALSTGAVYANALLGTGAPSGMPTSYGTFGTVAGGSSVTSIAADRCGNVYAAASPGTTGSGILRLQPDGTVSTVVVNGLTTQLRGTEPIVIGVAPGADPHSLYALDIVSRAIVVVPLIP